MCIPPRPPPPPLKEPLTKCFVPATCADGMISRGTDWFLGFVDYVAGWAHYLSTVTTPWGSGSEISCISAIYLALLVRFVVATVFSGVRFALALPVSLGSSGFPTPPKALGLSKLRPPFSSFSTHFPCAVHLAPAGE